MAFSETGEVTLDGSGNGTIRLSVVPMSQKRDYIRVAVFLSTGESSLGGNAKIYAGDEVPNKYVDGTVTPWLDNAGFAPGQCQVVAPEQLTVVFTGCDPNAQARVNAQWMPVND